MSVWEFIIVISLCFISKTLAQNKDLFIRNKRPLPIDGSWSDWESWSLCYTNRRDHKNFYAPLENYIIQSRNRSCNSPKPIHGGKDCKPPSHRFRQCSCMNPLGMSTKIITDSQITSSSFLPSYPPYEGRLNESSKGWCSKHAVSHMKKAFIQIDFNKFANVGAIKTLENEKGRTVFYKAEYSLNGKDWKQIQSTTRSSNFKGNLLRGKESQANFSQHKVMKHLRVSPVKTYRYPCLKMEVMGCMFTCGSILTESFGKISARSRIDIDQNCLWRIEVLNTTSLTFDFTIFDILCSHGYLDFHNGDMEFSNAPLLKRVCLKNRDEEPSLFTLNSNVVWLNFVSNSSDSEDGFSIRYFSACKQNIQLIYGEPVIVKSPNYPKNYFGNLECSWVITAPKNDQPKAIDITIKDDFNVESVNKSMCSDDVVIIKYYKNNKDIMLGHFCNAKKPEEHYQLEADKIDITFKTDPILAKKGFHIMVISGVKVKPTAEDTTTTLISNPSSEGVQVNGSGNVSIRKKKENDDGGSHWTVIIISAFSAFAFILLVFVVGSNIRRYINNRNELNAQCAKVAAKNKEKQFKESKNKKQQELKALLHQEPVHIVASPGNIPVDNQNNIKTCQDIDHDDSVDEEHSQLMSPTTSERDSELDGDVGSPVAELDAPPKYDKNSILYVHSPLKYSSTSNTSTGDVNNECDAESCV